MNERDIKSRTRTNQIKRERTNERIRTKRMNEGDRNQDKNKSKQIISRENERRNKGIESEYPYHWIDISHI